MLEHEVHAASDVARLQLVPASAGTIDLHRDRLRTILRMTRNRRLVLAVFYDLVAMMPGFQFKHGAVREIIQVDALLFGFGLTVPGIHFVAQVRMRHKRECSWC